jgi:hypothetical protein
MTRFTLILALLLALSLPAYSQGSSIGTAAPISANGSVGGTMSDQSEDHYWQVTTSANGYLRIQVTSSSSIDADVTLYDTDRTSSIAWDGQYGTYSEVFRFLKPGTYYIKVYRWSGTTGTYTLASSFASPSRADDTELNDSPLTALSLSPTGTSTGHLGFFGSGSTDDNDYWKITTTQDGWLRVQVRSDSLDLRADGTNARFDLDATLYDVDGTSSYSWDGRDGTFSQVDAFVRPGTYFVKVNHWIGRGGSYQITSEFFAPPLANDVEGNDSYSTASTAPVNGSVTGHLGYYSNGTTDYNDYWKFTTTSDGRITVQVTSDSLDRSDVALDLDLTIYDVNGTSSLFFDGRSGKVSEGIVYLRPGTFFARVNRWQGNGGSYTLTITQTQPPLANDAEPNDSYGTAAPLTFGATSTGHLGYFVNGATDTQDYWRLVAPSSDSIYVHVTSETTADLDVSAYGPDGTSSLDYDGGYGVHSRVGIKPTAGTTYYFKVYLWTGTAGSYSIVANRSSVAVGIAEESAQRLVPTELTLEQNFPNPFNPTTTIRYALPKEAKVRLAVYSILGQEVAVLHDGMQSAAFYSTVWHGKDKQGVNVPSGIYLIRLQADEQQFVRKAVLIR